MQVLLKIALLFFVVQLPLNTMGEMGSAEESFKLSEIHSAERTQIPFGYPEGNSNLYAIHHQAESSAEITNRVPQPQSTTERKYELFSSSAPESAIKQWLLFYIEYGSLIEPGLTTGQLLFPFHFFL